MLEGAVIRYSSNFSWKITESYRFFGISRVKRLGIEQLGIFWWLLGIITKIRNKKLDTHFCSKPHEFSDEPIEPPKDLQLRYSTEQTK
jgi:hypothetical protein